jgi:hypothetical protein
MGVDLRKINCGNGRLGCILDELREWEVGVDARTNGNRIIMYIMTSIIHLKLNTINTIACRTEVRQRPRNKHLYRSRY